MEEEAGVIGEMHESGDDDEDECVLRCNSSGCEPPLQLVLPVVVDVDVVGSASVMTER